MDFALSEQQEMLKKSAFDFLTKECTKKLVREAEQDEKGYSPDLWQKMADLGWIGLVFPEQYGGGGLSFIELTTLLEEMGKALVPGPFLSTVVGGLAVLKWGSEAQKKEFLPRIAKGKSIVALAIAESNATYDASGIKAKAVAEGKDFIINGTKLFVTYGHVADYLIVAARTTSGRDKQAGITVFIVNAKSAGISRNLLKTFTGDKKCEVVFKNVRVPKVNVLGKLDKGWEVVEGIIDLGAFALCPWMTGGTQQALDMAVAYAKERVQFERPIGSFQAIQHKCANIVVDVAGARDITYLTAWKLSEGIPCQKDISIAKAWISEAYRKACVEGIQIHGGIGITQDHDMQLYYRRAKAAEIAFGDADYHLERLSHHMGL
jgi:alkylation response protein AidB-like acyl-CoA dehydrogenase